MATGGADVEQLTERGWDAQRIADSLNEQRVTHPMGSRWTAEEIVEWYPATRQSQQPETPEQHAEAQRASARAVAQPEQKTGRERKKFAGEERMYVYGRVKAMLEAKMESHAIASALTAEGIVSPNGRAIDASFVTQTKIRWTAKPELRKKYASILMPRIAPGKLAAEPPPPRAVVIAPASPEPKLRRSPLGLPATVDAVLGDASISADQRLAVLLCFASIPLSARALLDDGSVAAAAKITIIETVGTAISTAGKPEQAEPLPSLN